MALYRAKSDGRGTFRYFEPEMDARAQARRALEMDMRLALTRGEFELYYQPIAATDTGEVSGFEALIRWNHPVRGLVSPDEFIPLAEDTGLIVPVGEWVLREACRQGVAWGDEVTVAVNLSSVQFRSRNLVAAVVAALDMSGFPPCRLELEITETVLLQETEMTMAVLHKLRDLGVKIAMDDFGTGYSSLSYLRSFPFDKIKIDRSFVRDLGKSPDCGAIISAVTSLAARLGVATVAEGVETVGQLEELRRQGCTQVQGFLFSPPVPASQVSALLPSGGRQHELRARIMAKGR
jgi:EAL domain-containing protein (putative c-di-GMP-specific phosphodiesterase class I)